MTLENDYVILKLDNPLDFNDDVRPACLPSSSDFLDINSGEMDCWTSGWGLLHADFFDDPEGNLYSSVNTVMEFHREAGEIQCIFGTLMNILKGFVCIL